MPRLEAWAPGRGGEQEFQTPASGIAPNGLPYFSWDQGAVQLNRGGHSWNTTLGTPVTITYGYRESGAPPAGSGVSGFQQFNAIQIQVTEQLLQRWAEVANITFVRVGDGYTNNATMLFGNFVTGPAQFSAFAYLPSPGATAAGLSNGDVWVNISRDYDANPLELPRGAQILLHEIGHTFGLLHPSEYGGGAQSGVTYNADADFWQDTRQFTVQSYFSETHTGASYGEYWVLSPQMFDIAAAQRLFGANMTTRTGDTIYGFHSNTGISTFSLASSTQGAVFCIWDAGGIDTLDLSGYGTESEIDLRPESFSSAGGHSTGPMIGNISIARGVIIENAIGGSGNDIIIGNDANNTLIGGAGADRIDGGAGDDVIFYDAADQPGFVVGGAGQDVLVFIGGAAPTGFNLFAQGFERAEGRLTDTGANAWATQITSHDSQWRLDFTIVTNDDGSRSELDYDQVSIFAWASNWNHYASDDALDINVTTYDDGVVASNDFDEGNAFSWTSNYNEYDALSQLNINVTVFDNGITAAYDFDQTSSFNWVSNYNEYAVGGALDLNVTIYDDASYAVNEYDEGAEFDWTTNWESYDTLGRLDQNVVEYDNGNTAVLDYDQADQFTWATIWQLFDSGGNLIGYQGVNDDGSLFGGP